MADGNRRLEDFIPLEDLLKLDPQVLTARVYQQVFRLNGTILLHCQQIEEMEKKLKLKAEKEDLEKLETKVDDKVGFKELSRMEKLFISVSVVVLVLFLAFNIWDRIAGL